MRYRNRSRADGMVPFVDPLFIEAMSPRHSGRESRNARADQKAIQLCRQVQRALDLALAGECGDDVLRDLWVESVVPAPDAAHLLVRLDVSGIRPGVSLAEILDRLGQARGRLRRAVTEAITRKRSPELTFVPVFPGEVTP